MNTNLYAFMAGLLVFTTTLTGIMTVNDGFANVDNKDLNQSELKKLDKSETLRETTRTGRERASSAGSGIESGLFVLGQVWDTIKTVFSALGIVDNILGQAIKILHLPAWIQQLGYGLASLGVVFGVVKYYRGVQG